MPIYKIAKPEFNLSLLKLPLFSSAVRTGFPSPADDFMDRMLDLNEYLVKHPSSTFFARAEGNSLQGIGIYDKDILIVDRSLETRHGAIVIAAVNGDLTCKILDKHHQLLLSANPDFPPIQITDEEDMVIEGVVVHSIKTHLN